MGGDGKDFASIVSLRQCVEPLHSRHGGGYGRKPSEVAAISRQLSSA
jgi:hypothetical protein